MTNVSFRSDVTKAADSILKADKAKLQWSKLPIADLPRDLQALAAELIDAECAARAAKAALQAALDDKVEAPAGKRLVVTLGRDVSPATDSLLVAWTAASAGSTRVISFAQFVKG